MKPRYYAMRGLFLLVVCLSTTAFMCHRNGTSQPGCNRAFVFWHVQFIGETTETPKLCLEDLNGTPIPSDESDGGGKPCYPPGSCGKSFKTNGIEPNTYRAYAQYQGKKYYYTGNREPVRTPDNHENAATITAESCRSYVLEMIVAPQ